MQSPGFQGAPISKILLFFTIGSSIIANLADVRRNISLPIDVHTLQSKQLWRLFAWPIAYINTTDVFCASLTIYSFRCLERVWGSRKLLSFLLTTSLYTTVLSPLLLLTIRYCTAGYVNISLPLGPTGIIFALLAQYTELIPAMYYYRLNPFSQDTGDVKHTGNTSVKKVERGKWWAESVLVSSKFTAYILPLRLAMSSGSGSMIVAGVGWLVGMTWRRGILPGCGWRVGNKPLVKTEQDSQTKPSKLASGQLKQ